jgi:hypothetical protein
MFSATGLPPGLSLDTFNAAVTGTPSQAGIFNVTVSVSDSSDPRLTASATFTWTVNSPDIKEFVGFATRPRQSQAIIAARNSALAKATAAGYGHCEDKGDPQLDQNEEGSWTAMVTLRCEKL